ncbi:MarR family winged helix-turn-helix transcriptional regulator [uncultured Oscillibacter sp.]|uniref:MarR family winged helix-turn-helix transcriptional regulator n=1 Tax=uncultured Oscillibacter sp. TaxID=876091 RepID=UPI0035A66B24
MEQHLYMRCISLIYRQGNRFYDRELSRYGIGCGQQFSLLRIYEHQGISVYDLALIGHFDKGTVSKELQKLVELGYVVMECDPKDRRVRRLYTTEAAQPIVEGLYAAREAWSGILTAGLSGEEAALAEELLEKMAENAYVYMNKKEPDHHV